MNIAGAGAPEHEGFGCGEDKTADKAFRGVKNCLNVGYTQV